MNNQPVLPDNETLPIAAARSMAFLTLAMSMGFVAILFFFFLKDVFHGVMLWGVLLVMLGLAVFSSTIALQRLMPKIRCPHCAQPFFARVTALFAKPARCAACNRSPATKID